MASRTSIMREAVEAAAHGKAEKAAPKVEVAARKAWTIGEADTVLAVDLGTTTDPAEYVGKGRSWRSVWYSLTVNGYRRDGQGSDAGARLVGAVRGVPVIVANRHAFLVVTGDMLDAARGLTVADARTMGVGSRKA